MAKLIVSTFLTLDGVMQAPGGPDEDTSGGFQHGGWQLQGGYFDDEQGKAIERTMAETGGFLLGRRTYDIFAAYWPHATGDDAEFAQLMNDMPTFVASRTLQEPLEWKNSTLLKGDVANAVKELKERPGRPCR